MIKLLVSFSHPLFMVSPLSSICNTILDVLQMLGSGETSIEVIGNWSVNSLSLKCNCNRVMMNHMGACLCATCLREVIL